LLLLNLFLVMFEALPQCYLLIFYHFVDAHTKFIWFYPIVIKSDVFNVFHQFQVFVE